MAKFVFFILYLSLCNLFGQSINYYHKYRPSDSELVLTNWRVDENEKGDNYIIETVDGQGRVTEIRIMQGNVLFKSDCYNNAIIKFEYEDKIIIETNYDNDSTLSAGIECGAPAKIIYYLENGFIKKCKKFLGYDVYLNGSLKLDPEFRDSLEKEKKENIDGIVTVCKYVLGYNFSSAKYGGFLPTSKGFNSKEIFIPYSDGAKNCEFSINNSKLLKDK